MILAGIDIGGTKMEVSLFEVKEHLQDKNFDLYMQGKSLQAKKILAKRVPTDRQRGYEKVSDSLAQLILDTLKEAQISFDDLNSIGIGLPGIVDPISMKMENGNTGIFIGKDLVGDLKRKINSDVPIYVANDANCFALAEAVAGAGVNYQEESGRPISSHLAVGVILGTGCGGGIINGARMLTGRNGATAEIGHSTLITNGHACYCGKNGCAEQYLSGPGLEAAYASRIYTQIDKRPNAREIFDMAVNQEPQAKAQVKQFKRHLAEFIANLSNILDADYFVLGGGLSLQPAIYEGIEDMIRQYTFSPGFSPRIYQHVLGDSAGGIGAALLALQN